MYLLRQKTFCAVVKHKKYMNPLRTSGPGTSTWKFTTVEFGLLLSPQPRNRKLLVNGIDPFTSARIDP